MNEQDNKFSHNGNGKPDWGQFLPSERHVKLRDYIRVVYRGRYAIIISFTVVFLLSIIITFSTRPVYEASAKLILEEQSGVGESLFDITSMIKKETMINNQVEILKSRTLAEYVISDLRESSVANELQILGNGPDKNGRNGGFFHKLFAGKKENEKGQLESMFDMIVENLRNNIRVIPIRNTDVIEIKVRAHSPFEAAYVTNAVATAYRRLNQEQSQKEVRQVKNFLEEQLGQYEKDLSQSEEALKNYKERAKVVALPQETEELVRKSAEFETLYNAAKTEMEAAKRRLEYIDNQLAKQHVNIDIGAISSQPYLDELKRQIGEKEAERAKYVAQLIELGAYEDNKERIKQEFEVPIEALKQKFTQEVAKVAAAEFVDPMRVAGDLLSSKIAAETEFQSLQPKVEAFGKMVEEYDFELEALPEKSLTLARLMRTAQVDEKIYIMLQEKYQESRITEVGQLGNVRIIDQAVPIKSPVSPKKNLNLFLGIVIGLGLGLGLAFTMEYLDSSMRTAEDVETLGLPLLITIPSIKPVQSNGVLSRFTSFEDKEAEAINERLVCHLKAKSPIAEAYRTMRTNILFSAPENPKHVIMITSSGPKEGKSTSVSNLAITFSQMGTKTLLIDGDLRRPMVHKLFNVDKSEGLTNVLVGKTILENTVRQIDELPNLDILTCGIIPPNPSELLGSIKMKNLLSDARGKYGMILIDTPPIIAVTDPSVLSPLVDGVILVIRSGVTQREAVVRAIDQLRRVEAPLLGILLNDLKVGDMYGSYYYYYYYYYDSDGEKKKHRSKQRKKSSSFLRKFS
ncbi:polysaccharide biosynthesis tyrosine autokinase [candidate division KSB1 bacterium]|nr:polysaccharide biosynthesis tyrosine autokinase [candidate division KSB1 bacterium]